MNIDDIPAFFQQMIEISANALNSDNARREAREAVLDLCRQLPRLGVLLATMFFEDNQEIPIRIEAALILEMYVNLFWIASEARDNGAPDAPDTITKQEIITLTTVVRNGEINSLQQHASALLGFIQEKETLGNLE